MTNPDPIPDPTLDYAHRHVTAEKDRVSLREKIGLGFGRAVVDGSHGTLHVLLYPVYNMTLGVSPAAISTVVFIQRLWDAMLDPFFGQFSDNFRSRWGRRRPLILAGAIPVALLFTALWWFPKGASHGFLFSQLLIVSLIFYAAHSLFSMPLGGLIIEATDDYHERTKIAGITLAFGFAVQVGAQWIFPLMEAFPSPISGVRFASILCGGFFIIAGLLPVFLCRERLYKKVAVKQKRVGFMQGLRAASGSRSFMLLLAARGIFSFGFNVVGQLGNYMYIYFVYGGDKKAASINFALNGSSYHVAAILTSIGVFPYLERWIGKRRTMQASAVAMMIGCVLKVLVYHPGWRWLPFLVTASNGISNAGVSMMSIAMLADIADDDEYKTGLRREGLFTALLSWFDKAGNSLGSFLTGFILIAIGFDAGTVGGAQTEHTLWLMKFWYVALPASGAIITFILIHFYTLTQDQMYAIKDELGRRRAVAAATDLPESANAFPVLPPEDDHKT